MEEIVQEIKNLGVSEKSYVGRHTGRKSNDELLVLSDAFLEERNPLKTPGSYISLIHTAIPLRSHDLLINYHLIINGTGRREHILKQLHQLHADNLLTRLVEKGFSLDVIRNRTTIYHENEAEMERLKTALKQAGISLEEREKEE